MIEKLKKLLGFKKDEKKDFSSFFNLASLQERTSLMEEVTRKANLDQRAMMEHKYNSSNQ